MFRKRPRCPRCGARPQPNATICPHCGQELVTQKESEHCPACGARMLVSEGTCPICGARRHVPHAVSIANVWAVVVSVFALLALAGALWLVRPWSELAALLEPTSILLPTPTRRVTSAPSLTLNPTPTRKLSPTVLPSPTEPAPTPTVPTATSTATFVPTALSAVTPGEAAATAPNLTPTAAPPQGGPVIHIVQAGDTLGGIGAQYAVSGESIAQANGIKLTTILRIGQELVIPVAIVEATPSQTPPSPEALTRAPTASPSPSPTETLAATPTIAQPVIHVVKAGDLLGAIAARYDVSKEGIARANSISVNSILSIGQELVIPVATPAATEQPIADATLTAALTAAPAATPTGTPTAASTTALTHTLASGAALPATLAPTQIQTVTHTVEEGDTLLAIAGKYQVSSEDIAETNGIGVNDTLSVGQQLVIPGITPPATAIPTVTPSLQVTSTSTLSPTATAIPTITPTPAAVYAYRQPHLLAPVNGGVYEGEEAHLLLNWSSVGILGEGEWYLLALYRSEDSVEPIKKVWTKATSYRLPQALYPKGQPACHFYWQVAVVSGEPDGEDLVALSPASVTYAFCWR